MRVDLPLALEHIRVGCRPVGLVRCAYRLYIESVCEGIDADALKLPSDHSFYHFLELGILAYITHIRPHLRTRITQPHSRDVACVYECIRLTFRVFAVVDSCIKCVGIAVGKHPAQAGVLQHAGHLGYLLLYGLGCKKTSLRLWTLVHILGRLICAIPHLWLRSHRDDEFSSGHDVLMFDISLCICFAVEGDALDIAVFGAVVLGSNGEISVLSGASGHADIDADFVEERSSEPVLSRSRLHLVESHRRHHIPGRHLTYVLIA